MLISAIKKALRKRHLRKAEREKWQKDYSLMVDNGAIKTRHYRRLKLF